MTDEVHGESQELEEAQSEDATTVPDAEHPESFPREYVEKLRRENGKYRQRAQEADDLAHRLHSELVKATGRLADPSDLPFDEQHLNDPESLNTSVDELLDRKPHLASRVPQGNIGQGASKENQPTSLADILRQAAN